MTRFRVLVGPDGAGKSTVLDRLHREHGWQVVSYDDQYLHRHAFIRHLRQRWVGEAFVHSGGCYSSELVVAALHPIVLHLRDQLARAAGPAPVIVDSYYYKLLAKCLLLGVHHRPTFDLWRSFPRPAGVFWLDVPPAVAWLRTGDRLNPFEHYGPVPGRSAFVRLQTDLRAVVEAEVGDVPMSTLDGCAPVETIVAAIQHTVQPVAAS